jgi:hypothetical protein
MQASTENTESTENTKPVFQQEPQFPNNDVAQRRNTDSSMDMFRNMARDINKSR